MIKFDIPGHPSYNDKLVKSQNVFLFKMWTEVIWSMAKKIAIFHIRLFRRNGGCFQGKKTFITHMNARWWTLRKKMTEKDPLAIFLLEI